MAQQQKVIQPHGTSGPVTLVLLHGLLRSPAVLSGLGRKLEKATGWRTLNLGYPSRSQPLDSLAKGVAAEIVHEVGPGGQVFLVTHSLGGIVFRHIAGMQDVDLKWIGVVMLGPPNNGSGLAQTLSKAWGIAPVFGFFHGQAGLQLAAEVAAKVKWPYPSCPCGVIAGTRSLSLWPPSSWLTTALHLDEGGGDGTVSVPETRLPPQVETDFATVHAYHSGMMRHPDTLPLILCFMQHFKFSPPAQTAL